VNGAENMITCRPKSSSDGRYVLDVHIQGRRNLDMANVESNNRGATRQQAKLRKEAVTRVFR
jgi:hypothetical protein